MTLRSRHRRESIRTRTRTTALWLAVVGALCGSVPLAVLAATPAAGEATVALAVAVPDTLTPIPRRPSPEEWDALRLARATTLLHEGDDLAAAALLEEIETRPGSAFARADRAAFLLATIYLDAGDGERVARLVATAGDADSASPYRRWIAYLGLLRAEPTADPTADPTANAPVLGDYPGATVLHAALLLEAGRPAAAQAVLAEGKASGPFAATHLYLQAIAARDAGDDPEPIWRKLAGQDPQSSRDADLVGAALVELAALRLESGDAEEDAEKDAEELLRKMPSGSRLASRADHVLALTALARGDTNAGGERLRSLLAENPGYPQRRQVLLELGALAASRDEWTNAVDRFSEADSSWRDAHDALDGLVAPDSSAAVWAVWEQLGRQPDEIRLATDAVDAALDDLATLSLDLNREADLAPRDELARDLAAVPPPPSGAASDLDRTARNHRPSAAEWDSLSALYHQREQAAAALARQDYALAGLGDENDRRRAYLLIGYERAGATGLTLDLALGRLDSLVAHLDSAAAALDTTRDHALARFAGRTAAMAEELRRNVLYTRALHHFHLEGPIAPDVEKVPEGVPSPGELLALEATLAREVESFLMLFARRAPELVARSCAEIWKPRLLGDAPALQAALRQERERAVLAGASLAASLAALETDSTLAAAMAYRDELAAAQDSLVMAEAALRGRIALKVAERGRASLAAEREAIDYHLADASYWRAIALATDPATAEDAAVVAPARDRALGHLVAFLERHPESAALSEARFRQADLELLRSRDVFEARMASFLDEKPSGEQMQDRALAPFVDYGLAIALYGSILAEDPDFAHLDAVLFNLGMILADDGQPVAEEHLQTLVAGYPTAPGAQEAWLRLGDIHFERNDYGGCQEYYEQAAAMPATADPDPALSAIALYKLGWAHFKEDRFTLAADAFRRLLDLHDETGGALTSPGGSDRLDLAGEAEDHLVHALVRAGGAGEFRSYFDGLGGRPYEARVLSSMSRLFRDFALYVEAVECDRLWLARYPDDPRALDVAGRLVDTYHRWDRPDEARRAQLATAAAFLPASSWLAANPDTALVNRGRAYAQTAYRSTAEHNHREARESDDPATWRLALEHYEAFLTYWPADATAPRMHYQAGDAAAQLDAYPVAVRHFEAAAASDTASFAADAKWQVVVVTDTWYRSTQSRPAGDGTARDAADAALATTGSDSLAAALLAAGDAFVASYPADERAADLLWRQGNVAYAHGWGADAADRLVRFGREHPEDERALRAVRMAGDALYRVPDYAAAGVLYEEALVMARTAGADSVAADLAAAIPVTYYRHAESVAAADGESDLDEGATTASEAAAPHFAEVAARWPSFEYADLALYRAGLGYAAGDEPAAATTAWETLLRDYPTSEYGRDSAMQVARTLEENGDRRAASAAYARFSRIYRDDDDAPEALLHATDLLAEVGDEAGVEELRSTYLQRFPEDWETAIAIRSERAAAELAGVSSGGVSIGALLGGAAGVAGAASAAGSAAQGAAAATTPSTDLQVYLELAAAHPESADPRLLAMVDFYTAEEAMAEYTALPLNQPLPPAIERKKAALEEVVALYGAAAERGDEEFARASAFRIGAAIVHFGEALLESERPADLSGEDLYAYEDVLDEQSWSFFDRGEDAWTELLRQTQQARDDDPGGWIARTQEELWPRLALRFMHQPELDYPLVSAPRPEPKEADSGEEPKQEPEQDQALNQEKTEPSTDDPAQGLP